jgi:small subunit ribosomal protein S4
MARYTGPTTRINRRFGMSIFRRTRRRTASRIRPASMAPVCAAKCRTIRSALMKSRNCVIFTGLRKSSSAGPLSAPKASAGVTGEIFVQMLEKRLDAVLYSIGFAKTRRQARQFVTHGHVKVNGQKVDIPSFSVSAGDTIEVKEATSSRQLATRALEDTRIRNVPLWLTRNDDALTATVNREPTADDIETGINVQLIVEFYSR